MSRSPRTALLLALMLVGSPTVSHGDQRHDDREVEKAAPDFVKLQTGMTPEQVRRIVGPPQRIARQILYHRYREQWLYDLPLPIRLTFECRRGQKPQLLAPPRLPSRKDNSNREQRR